MIMQEFNEIVKNRDFELIKNVKSQGIKIGTIWNRDFLTNDDLIEYDGKIYRINDFCGIIDIKEA